MTTIGVFQSLTLDGVMQGPGRADEDTRGGFTQGGWANGYQDNISASYAGEGMARPGALLFGRRTYEDVLTHWTKNAGPNPFADVLLRSPKYVVSRSAGTELEFANSRLLAGDAVDTVRALCERNEVPHLMIMGSGELIRSLHAVGLIDTYSLLIHPIALGTGTRMFGEADRVDLELTRATPTSTGVLIAEYAVRR
ncbi:dihydrofolate reductase family protein [Rathayibacter sp. CAU 1779]